MFSFSIHTLAIDIAYPLLNIVTFFIIATSLLSNIGKSFNKEWCLISISIILIAMTDIIFGYTVILGFHHSNRLTGLLFNYAFILFTLVMIKTGKTSRMKFI
jgi:hypothetical protein